MVGFFTGAGAGLVRSSANILGGAGLLGNSSLGRGNESVSVNAATGNLFVGHQDEFLIGRGLDVGISRAYNSLADTTDGDNGDQWQFNTNRRVFGLTGTVNTAGSTVKRQSGDGSVVTYTWNAAIGAYLTTDGDGAHDTLFFASDQWSWTDGSSQTKENYSADGADNWRITRQKDMDGNKVQYTYIADKLDKVTTEDGSWIQYSWSGNNVTQIVTGFTDLATSTAKTSTSTRYSYDASNRLIQVTTDLSPDDNSIADGKTYVTTYGYDGSSKRIASIGQADGSSLTITYDGSGRVLTLTQTVAAGDTRVTSLSYGANYTSITGADGQVTRLDYDAAKQLTKITAPPAYSGATAQVVQFAYDANGNVTTVTDAKGGVTTYSYSEPNFDPSITSPANQSGTNDANGNVTKVTDANGNILERWYDASNRLIREKSTGSDDSGASVELNSHYAYDIEGHLRFSISPAGTVTEYAYNASGTLYWTREYPEHSYSIGATTPTEAQMSSWVAGLGDISSAKIKVYGYDARDNMVWSMAYGFATSAGAASGAEGYSRTYYTYDQAGRLLSRNNEGETVETFLYDGLDRLVGSTNVTAGTTTFVFNDAATTTTVTTAAGFVTTTTYNKAGELISETHSGSYDVTGTSTFKYDKNGRLRMSTDATGFNSYFLYDKAGRKIADINHYGDVIEYRYDANNNVIATTRYYQRTAAGNLTTLANPDNGLDMAAIRPVADASDLWSWTIYDAGNRIIQAIDGDGGVAAFGYDASNRLVRTDTYFNKVAVAPLKTAPPATPVAVTAHTKDTVSRTFYNKDGQLIGALDGEGYLSEVIYDKAGQKIEEVAYATKTSSSYWATGSFAQLRSTAAPSSSSNSRVRYVYDGQLLRYKVDMLGEVTGYTYNTAGKLTGTTLYAATINTTDFTYDNVKALVSAIANAANDRSATVNYNAQGLVSSSVDAGGLVTTLTYDSSGRVIKSVVGSGGGARVTYNYYTASGDLRFTVDAEGYVHRFDYDAEGRKTREVTWNTPITVSDSTTIAQVDAAATGTWVDVNYAYDAAGRVYSIYDGEGNRTVKTWYSNGMLAGIYAAYGTVDQSITYYGYDGAGRVVTEYGALGDTEQAYATYTYDGLGNRLTATDPNGKVTTFTYDEVGRVVTATDAAGGVTTYEYNAFGQVVKATDARGNSTYNYYDSLGRLSKVRDAESYVTETSYTAFGEIASVKRYYNKTTSAISTTTPPTVTAHANDATTSFEYDKLGRVTKSTDAAGFFETYTYDALGNRASKTAKSASGSLVAGGTTTYTYDKRGLLLTETLPMASYNNSGTLVSSTVTNKFEYDARGNRTKMIEAYGLAEARTTSYVYDKANRLVETIGQTFLGVTPHEYIAYDARGNVTRTIDAAGARTVFFYDDLNRKTAEINAAGTYTKYTYDKVGNVTEVRVYETAVAVPADGGSEEEAPAAPGGNARTTTFTYDNVNRMLTSSVTGVKTGAWNGSSWVSSTSAITTSYQYDANGNVVKTTDPNGNSTWSYYDALGRKTAQVDGENYITTWSYGSEGNVLSERRYWNKAVAPSSTTTPPAVTADANLDRITDFAYDLVGNRTVEIRRNVLVHNGSGATTLVDSTIGYSYNGLGQVTRKTEATGDFTDYVYDSAGRLFQEVRKAYTDQTGASVTPTVDYYYDGINNLSRTRQRGSGDSADRVTMYGYDGGKLRWIADAENNYTYYWYDVAGRQTHEYYTRTKSDGTTDTAYNGNLTSYDVLGRVASKWQADYAGNTWTTRGPVTQMTYNAFGDVASVVVGGNTIQQNQYDLAGRLTGTTSGDGIWKYFGYDKNGNQTVAIASAGGGLGGSFDAALSLVGAANVNGSYTVYDKRNLATSVVEEGRQFSVGGALQNLTTSRSYTAFGEVASETNALGATISYTYNNMGRMTRSESPSVEITLEDGTSRWVKPSEDYYYDASGRLVATRDANGSYAAGGTAGAGTSKAANTGNLTRLTLLTNTGYGNSRALVTAETHADGGVKQTKYDIHGDARVLIDELGRSASRTYDRNGRAVSVTNMGGLVDYYSYDLLGHQLKHWNSYLGSYEVETTDYDIQGRIVSQRSFGGDTTQTVYAWDGSIATSGVGTFGGWLQTTYAANGLYSQEKTDVFGRVTWKRDLGGHTTDYAYDASGKMASTSTNGMTVGFAWLNSGLQATAVIGTANAGQANTNWTRKTATYSYDQLGNRLGETLLDESGVYSAGYWENYYEYGYTYQRWIDDPYYYTTSQQIKNQSATYDALGRIKTWAEAGTSTSPASSTITSYDAGGNVRRTQATYYSLDANGAASYQTTRDYWFRYDSMNRVVVNQGVLDSGVITRGMGAMYGGGGGGQDILYDVAGQRTAVATTQAYFDGYGGYSAWESRENYFYDGAGRLSSTYQATGTAVSGGYGGTTTIPAASGTGTLRSAFYYDSMGRATGQTDYDTNGYTALFSRSASYNAKGQLTYDTSWTKKTDNKTYASTNYYYYTDYNSGQYMLGSVGWMQSTSTVNGGSSVTSRTVNGYVWWDSAVQASIQNKPNISQSTTYTTSFYLNNFGQLTGAYISDGKPRSVSFTLDELGQIIRRDESAVSGQTGAPHEVWYRYGGRQLGYTGNNGTSDISYDASINERRIVQPTSPGTYRNGQTYGTSYADFAQNYDPINSYYQGATGGTYKVQQGDTLQNIAQNLWGDASLWYKLAEANGMSSGAGLIAGQTLILPTGVMRSKNNAGTVNPYNPAEAIGDLSPTVPQPPKKAKCGVFGAILLAVISIAIAVALPMVAPATFGGFWGGMGAAVVGNLVSQGVGLATGIQEKFSFKSVALAALSAGVSGGIGPDGLNLFGSIGSKFVQGAVSGAVGSAITQGIAVATGLQDKFDWAGVAAAGVGGGIGAWVGGKTASWGTVGNRAAAATASAIASAVVQTLASGRSFGDNLLTALPGAIGQTLGGLIGERLTAPSSAEWRSAESIAGDWKKSDQRALIDASRGLDYVGGKDPGTIIQAAAGNADQSAFLRQFTDATRLHPSNYSFQQIASLYETGFTLAGVPRGVAGLAVDVARGPTYGQYRSREGQSQLRQQVAALIRQNTIQPTFADGDVRTPNSDAIDPIILGQIEAFYNGTETNLNITGQTPTTSVASSVSNALANFQFNSTDQAAAAIAMVMQTHLLSLGTSADAWNEWGATIYDNGSRKYVVGPIREANSTSGAQINFSEMVNNPGWTPAASWHLHPGTNMSAAFFSGQDYEGAWAIQQIFPRFKSYMTVAVSYGDVNYPYDAGSTSTAVSPWATFALGERLQSPANLPRVNGRFGSYDITNQNNVNHRGIRLTLPSGGFVVTGNVSAINARYAGTPTALYEVQQGLVTIGGVQKTVTINPYVVTGTQIPDSAFNGARRVMNPR